VTENTLILMKNIMAGGIDLQVTLPPVESKVSDIKGCF
jgi:hypothetical protein